MSRGGAIIRLRPIGSGGGPPAHHRHPRLGRLRAMLRGHHPAGHLWPATTQPIQLLDAPVEIAHSMRRWLRGLTVGPNRQSFGDHRTVVADQVRELIFALHRTTAGLAAIVDLMLATATAPRSATGHRTVTIDLTGRHNGMREAADILATIDHLAMAGDSEQLATPADARRLIGWIADEIDAQSDGRPPTSYAAPKPLHAPPCPLLCAAGTRDLGRVTVHAYRHRGWSAPQIASVRASDIASILAASPGATLDRAIAGSMASRLDLLAELGQLIELGAVFGIDHRWYPYDITPLALRDGDAAQQTCGCPSAS